MMILTNNFKTMSCFLLLIPKEKPESRYSLTEWYEFIVKNGA